MLSRISIKNYAIIDELEISLPGGFSVITGETGAGKSIIVGALGLILGERADTSVLVNKEKKCVIEGEFGVSDKDDALNSFFLENDIDKASDLIIRREINANGKSRAFINDTPVTLSQLNQLGGLLVDLHQQFDTLELSSAGFQRRVIDALAGHFDLIKQYQVIFKNWQKEKSETELLKEQKQQLEREADYNRFQYTELEEAAFKENELEEADAALKIMANAETIKETFGKAYFILEESEAPVVQQLKSLYNQLSSHASYHPALSALLERLQSVQVELKDIAGEISSLSDEVKYDPGEIARLNERLSLGYKLQKKHGVSSTKELAEIQAQLGGKLKNVLDLDDQINEKEKQAAILFDKAVKLADKISTGRKKQVKPFEEKVNGLLKRVGMPNAQVKAEIRITEPNLFGSDEVEFLFDANLSRADKEGSFQPLKKVASGGELSRLMLCIKSLVARSMALPTLIFDEIDTGISGEAARQVGVLMKELAAQHQVICITHQPQIAGKADAHFFVYKEIAGDAVRTNTRLLNVDERITAIARMLSGEKPTAAAMENAKEMIMN